MGYGNAGMTAKVMQVEVPQRLGMCIGVGDR